MSDRKLLSVPVGEYVWVVLYTSMSDDCELQSVHATEEGANAFADKSYGVPQRMVLQQ